MDEIDCSLDGNADMYGLGIRLGFYLQWLAGSLAAVLIVKDDVKGVRSALFAFTLATFLAVIVEAAKPQSSTSTVDIYISLLLCFGFFYYFLPRALWRLYCWIKERRDDTNFTVVVASPEFDILQLCLLLAVTAMKIWFWTTMVVRTSRSSYCRRYGFLFYPYWMLDSLPMRIINIIIDVAMVFPLIYEMRSALYRYFRSQSDNDNPDQLISQTRSEQFDPEQLFSDKPEDKRSLMRKERLRFVISAVVVAATETTIYSNHLKGMYNMRPAGQLIPFVLGVYALLHVLYRNFRPDKTQETSAELFVETWLGDKNKVYSYLTGPSASSLRGSKYGHLVLHAAAAQNHPHLIVWLLTRGHLNVDAVAPGQLTALYVAAERGYDEVVVQLLERGAEPNIPASGGNTPLHMAAKGGFSIIVDQLIRKGAKPSVKNLLEETAMFGAIERGDMTIVGSLVEAGADINEPISKGRSALNIAVSNGDNGMIRNLVKLGAKIDQEPEWVKTRYERQMKASTGGSEGEAADRVTGT